MTAAIIEEEAHMRLLAPPAALLLIQSTRRSARPHSAKERRIAATSEGMRKTAAVNWLTCALACLASAFVGLYSLPAGTSSRSGSSLPPPDIINNGGRGVLPAMGWNSWNTFRCDISEAVIKDMADTLVDSGLRDAGYTYLNLDDCWMTDRDNISGRIIVNSTKFPSGMKALGDYLHSRGLMFGIYSSAGDVTCELMAGSYGYEKEDARSYAEWGVDYLKYDYCGMEKHPEGSRVVYTRMRDALEEATRDTGRPILFSLCSWGRGSPHLWGGTVGHSWRTGPDVFAVWEKKDAVALGLPGFLQSIMESVDSQKHFGKHAGPGGFNDPDMLVVGLDDGMDAFGRVDKCPPAVPDCTPGEYIQRERWGKVGGLTPTEQVAHFSLWSIMASPLLLGNDPRTMSAETFKILTAKEVISVNQDPLALQGQVTFEDGPLEVWSKPLATGEYAILLFNRADQELPMTTVWGRDAVTAPEGELQRQQGSCANPSGICDGSDSAKVDPEQVAMHNLVASVRDLWLEEDLGTSPVSFSSTVPPHGVRMLRVRVHASEKTTLPEASSKVNVHKQHKEPQAHPFGYELTPIKRGLPPASSLLFPPDAALVFGGSSKAQAAQQRFNTEVHPLRQRWSFWATVLLAENALLVLALALRHNLKRSTKVLMMAPIKQTSRED